MSFSMLYFSIACVAQSTASCCMSSDMSAFLITAFRSDIVTLHAGESARGPGGAAMARGRARAGAVSPRLLLQQPSPPRSPAPAAPGRALAAAVRPSSFLGRPRSPSRPPARPSAPRERLAAPPTVSHRRTLSCPPSPDVTSLAPQAEPSACFPCSDSRRCPRVRKPLPLTCKCWCSK